MELGTLGGLLFVDSTRSNNTTITNITLDDDKDFRSAHDNDTTYSDSLVSLLVVPDSIVDSPSYRGSTLEKETGGAERIDTEI